MAANAPPYRSSESLVVDAVCPAQIVWMYGSYYYDFDYTTNGVLKAVLAAEGNSVAAFWGALRSPRKLGLGQSLGDWTREEIMGNLADLGVSQYRIEGGSYGFAETGSDTVASRFVIGDGTFRLTQFAGPSSTTVTVGSGNTVTVSWQAVPGEVMDYRVYRSPVANPAFDATTFVTTVNAPSTSIVLSNIPSGTHWIGVRARNRIRNGSGTHFELSPATLAKVTF